MKTIKYIILIGLFYAGASYGYKWWKVRNVEQNISQAGVDAQKIGLASNCKDKKFCITAYVAPWCGVCKSTEPTFKALHNYLPRSRPDVGFGLVIGAASSSENEQMSASLNPVESFIDQREEVMALRRVSAFPTWIVTDSNGQEVFRFAGGLSAIEDRQLVEFLKYMKL